MKLRERALLAENQVKNLTEALEKYAGRNMKSGGADQDSSRRD